jgi:metallo-beta-lactamase family protein
MLGSAIVVLDIEDRESHRDTRLVFSGDQGRRGIPIIRDPQTVESADILIMESTYGNRLHPPYADADKELERIINEAFHRGGKVIVPAFAVGRTQQLVFSLHQLAQAGEIPNLPIYVDSPLAIDATAIFRLHPEVYDSEILDFMMAGDMRRDPFDFGDLIYTRQVEASKKLNFLREPAIIIAASGMAEHGRILHHLKNSIEDERNTVLITGWQAEHTLGRRLVDGDPVVRIFGEEYQNKAHCEVLNGFSGHADHDELLDWVGAMRDKPRRIFLVHGELESAQTLADDLYENFHTQTDVPEWKQSYQVIL